LLTVLATSDNDSLVTEVDADEIFRETSESHRDWPFCVSLEAPWHYDRPPGCVFRAREADQTLWCLQPAIRTRTSSPMCEWTACELISILGLVFLALALLTSSPLTQLAVTRLSPSSANQHDQYSDSFRARISRRTCILHFSDRSQYGSTSQRPRFSLELLLRCRYRRSVL
jgi:hypothetical protein